MTYIRRLILALALSAGLAPAFAQVPPPVPALPDTERRTSYSITASVCSCNVNFALYGDSTDYANWIEVFVNGVRMAQAGNWTLSSVTGTIGSIPLPITNAVLTFTAPQTGTIQIVGARRPRRTSQFNEGAGVPTRNINVVVSDITATLREMWDKTNDMTGRGLFSQPGVTLSLLPLPSACAGKFLGFDATGLIPQCNAGGAGSGNIVGPLTSVIGHVALWNNVTGTLLSDGGVTITPSTGTLTLGAGKTLTVNNSLGLTGTDGTTMTFPTTSATIARSDAAQTFTGTQTIATIIGGSAAGSSITLQSTSNGAPSGDVASLLGSTVTLGNPVNGQSTINLAGPIGGGVVVNVASSGNGLNALNVFNSTGGKQIWIPAAGAGTTPGTIQFPVGAGTLSQTIASGSTALGTGAITSATCATVVTATATGTATTDVVTASFNGDPTAVTGYIPSTAGMLSILVYPTANTFNAKVCNNTNASVTPGAITLNWRVVR